MQAYIVVALPFVLAGMVFSRYFSDNNNLQQSSHVVKVLWELLAWNLMLWFVVLIAYLIMLVVMQSVRDSTLRCLANLKERDEREVYITGKAARTAYISTLSLMICLLFFSVFSVRVSKDQLGDSTKENQKKTLSISMGFSLFEVSETAGNRGVLFNSKSHSLSSSSVILILMCWQLFVFNLAARREQGEI